MWLSLFFEEAALLQQRPIILFIDNNRAINMTKTYWNHKKAKHIDVYYHFVKKKVEKGEFIPVYIPSKDNVTDLLTKPLLKETTRNFVIDLGLCSPKDMEEYAVVRK